jgi:hypothetical protein
MVCRLQSQRLHVIGGFDAHGTSSPVQVRSEIAFGGASLHRRNHLAIHDDYPGILATAFDIPLQDELTRLKQHTLHHRDCRRFSLGQDHPPALRSVQRFDDNGHPPDSIHRCLELVEITHQFRLWHCDARGGQSL